MHDVTHDYSSVSHVQHQHAPEKRALIVDNELSNRIILKSFLKKIGYSVIQAENGSQALDLFCTEQPDMMFMDVMMPIMDGLDAANIGASRLPALARELELTARHSNLSLTDYLLTSLQREYKEVQHALSAFV